MNQFLRENAKAVVAFLTAFATWGVTSIADDGIGAAEWFGLTGPFIVALGVWMAENAPTAEQLEELEAWKGEKSNPEFPDLLTPPEDKP